MNFLKSSKLSNVATLTSLAIIAMFSNASSTYAYIINSSFTNIVGGPLPDLATYSVTVQAGDAPVFDFHLEFPRASNYIVNLPLANWGVAQDGDGIHWANPGKNNPILPGTTVDFTAQLNDSVIIDAWTRLTNDGLGLSNTPEGTLDFTSNFVLYNLFDAGLVDAQGNPIPGASRSHVETNKKLISPDHWHIDSKGSIVYVDTTGTPSRGAWLLSSDAQRTDEPKNEWTYKWDLSNTAFPNNLPGGLKAGELIDFNDGIYPEKLPNGMIAGRSITGVWPGTPGPGGFDVLIGCLNNPAAPNCDNPNAPPLKPGEKATVTLMKAPPPRIDFYSTRWNPESNPGEKLIPTPVPEPSSVLGILALGTLGAASTLKRKLKSSKSSEKEATKVS